MCCTVRVKTHILNWLWRRDTGTNTFWMIPTAVWNHDVLFVLWKRIWRRSFPAPAGFAADLCFTTETFRMWVSHSNIRCLEWSERLMITQRDEKQLQVLDAVNNMFKGFKISKGWDDALWEGRWSCSRLDMKLNVTWEAQTSCRNSIM